jgi:WD40 repeat protein
MSQKNCNQIFLYNLSVVTGGKDMKLNLLDTKGTYKILLTVKILETVKGALTPEIKSVCISPDSKSILIGTAGCEIYELTTKV